MWIERKKSHEHLIICLVYESLSDCGGEKFFLFRLIVDFLELSSVWCFIDKVKLDFFDSILLQMRFRTKAILKKI
jgi:hypothetical protein